MALTKEIRVSPDGNMVAVRSDNPAEAWNAWGVMHAINGGHWSATSELTGWATVTAVVEPEPAPEPTLDPNMPAPPLPPEETTGG